MLVRPAVDEDDAAIWRVMEPIVRAGETYALPVDMSQADARDFLSAPGSEVFVAVDGGQVVGTYFMRPNQRGGGDHVCNCGYMTATEATGRGVASAMCAHSLDHALRRGYRAMQFNCVVSSNERAVRLWQHLGFQIVGTLTQGFRHPQLGYVDAYVMYQLLV